jgi:hypothetical protein
VDPLIDILVQLASFLLQQIGGTFLEWAWQETRIWWAGKKSGT